ncbi:MAG: phosphoglycerol geranylgeranyltransferase [Candidatus Zixiibacteriota bacterium]
MDILKKLQDIKAEKGAIFFLLIDPDKATGHPLLCNENSHILDKVDIILVGGSFLEDDNTDSTYRLIRKYAGNTPLISFPGSSQQLSSYADGILFTSLISGRNPTFLIEEQVAGAQFIKKHKIPTISTAYILIDSGKPTAVNKASSTKPLDREDTDNIASHILAGQYLGMQLAYLEGGSGASEPIDDKTIEFVCKQADIPIIAGGGIRSPEKAKSLVNAGASGIVIGNFAEESKNIEKVELIIDSVHSFSSKAIQM